MKVTTVSASVRFSKAVGKSQHKTAELSAEATIEGAENWIEAQASLYRQLGEQLKNLWGAVNGNVAHDNASGGAETPIQPSKNTKPLPIREYFCEEHQVNYRRYDKDRRVWYSHKTQDGKWCKKR